MDHFLEFEFEEVFKSFSPSLDVVGTSSQVENEISIFGISLARLSLSLKVFFLDRRYSPAAYFACFLDCLPTSRKQ